MTSSKNKIKKEKGMRKILKTSIASLSVLLLSGCTLLIKGPKDWTTNSKYADLEIGLTVRLEEQMPSLSFENDGWAQSSFAKVDFSGSVVLYSTAGNGPMTKMKELWNTEGKAAVHDVLINRWDESLFNNGTGMGDEGDVYDYLNALWFPVLTNNTNGDAQFFKKVTMQTTYEGETWYACYLSNLLVTYYAQDGSEIFKYSQKFPRGTRDSISSKQLNNQEN